ncbi:MAG TPA: DUF309 domain-containing protein [Gemmatales bacterium]|nr:DUF309 domain-containing protein [Gemmatales bacterium]
MGTATFADGWPPYTHIPGQTPHPESDPRGHSHGQPRVVPPPLEPERWQTSAALARGLALFERGFYWEAHEAWEGLWNAAGRAGPIADLLKGLIHLAAAGVKVREGRLDGVLSHAERARQLFTEVAAHVATSRVWLGFDLAEPARYATQRAATAATLPLGADAPPLGPLFPPLPRVA